MAKKIINTYHSIVLIFGLAHSFFFATYVLFLLEKGLDLLEVGLINSVYMLACFMFEMPTGSVADAYGRKRSFVLSCFFYSVSMFMYFMSNTFSAFVLAELVAALAYTFYSGAFKAWMEDSVRFIEPGYNFKPVYKYALIADRAGVISGSVIGAYVGKISLALPWLMSSIGMLIVGIVSMIIMKEAYFKPDTSTSGWQKIKENTKASIHYGYTNKAVLFSVLLAGLFGFACMAPNMYWQVILKDSFNMNVEYLGWMFALIQVTMVLGSLASEKVFNKLKKTKPTLLLSMLIFSAGLLLAALSGNIWLFVVGLAVHEFSRGIFSPVNEEYINRHIKRKEIRASVLSFDSMVTRFGAFAGLLIGGIVAKNFSPEASWIVASLVVLISLPYFLKFKNGE